MSVCMSVCLNGWMYVWMDGIMNAHTLTRTHAHRFADSLTRSYVCMTVSFVETVYFPVSQNIGRQFSGLFIFFG